MLKAKPKAEAVAQAPSAPRWRDIWNTCHAIQYQGLDPAIAEHMLRRAGLSPVAAKAKVLRTQIHGYELGHAEPE